MEKDVGEEERGYHIKLYKRVVEKRPELWKVVQKNLQELLDELQKNPEKLVSYYERCLSEEFLDKCDTPEKLWLFLILKFSLSYLNVERNVFNTWYDSIKSFYDNEIPSTLKVNVEFIKLLEDLEYRGKFLSRLYQVRRDLYLKLDKMLKIYDRFKMVSKRDEELEGKLNKKLALFRILHPIKFNKFIRDIEEKKPSILHYLLLLY
ncbi:MAG: hypothetical protein N3F64_03925 [Nitrososphaeria archaeon]|nr:hypothetical protein [Nitrososphaeria archaeon]